MPWKHGRGYMAWVPLRDGARKRVRLGTNDRQTARIIETMLRRLAGRREWELLDAIANGPSSPGELFDHWNRGDAGLDELKAKLSDIDLRQFVTPWRSWALRRATAATVERYARQIEVLMPEGVQYTRSRFTRKSINERLLTLRVSGSTARRYHAAWSSFARYLVEAEIIENNPLRSVTPPRNNQPRSLYLPLQDVVRLVDAQPEPYRALAALREGAGVEISAALGVCRRDVDTRQRVVHVHGTKNAWRDRLVFVEEWAWDRIARSAAGKLPDAPLFVDENGVPATYNGARSAHRAAVKVLGLPPSYRMHDARHSFAVRCMKSGIDPQLIANNLGHRDATMVIRVYGKYRPKPQDLRRARVGIAGGQ